MKPEEQFLNNWINDISREQIKGEHLEYSEREVLEMLYDYKNEAENLPISDVSDVVSYSKVFDEANYRVMEGAHHSSWVGGAEWAKREIQKAIDKNDK